MDNDKALPIEKAAQRLVAYREKLVEWLQEVLEDTLFSNRTFIRPSHLNQIAVAEADAFLAFLKSEDTTAVRVQGAKRAEEGVGEQAVLRVAATLRRFCHTHLEGELFQAGLAATDVYTNTFLEGFIETSETIILAEQERIRAALQRALSRYTLQLQTAAEVSRAATSILDLEELLTTSVEIIRERFDLDYAGLFLVDEYGEWAVLRAGTGKAGREMLRRGHKLKVGGESTIGWCIVHGQARIAPDVGQEAVRSDKPLVPEVRSELALPLISRGRVVGAMTLQRSGVAAFSDEDITTLQTMADQLANAIENAQIYEEERKRVTQLELIGGITQKVTSILDLDELLHQVVRLIRDTFGYYNTGILLVEADSDELILRAGAGPFAGTLVDRLRLKIGREGITGWVAHSGEPLLVNDVSREPRYYFVEESKDAKSELAVPIKLKGEIIGVLDVQSAELDTFSQDDVSLLQTLANQLAIAIENARLFRETKRRIEEMTALYQISLDITAQLGMAELLKSIVERAVTLLQGEGGGIYLYDPKREDLRLAIGYGHAEEYVGTILKLGESMAGKVFQTGEPLIVDDYRTWEGRAPVYEADQPFTAMLEVPLRWQERVIGVLAIDADMQKRTFNQDDLWLATLFANQAAVAIENARLYQQTDEKLQTRVKELSALYAIAEMVNHSLDLDAILRLALDSAIEVAGTDSGWILLLDPPTDALFLRAHRGGSPELIRAVSHAKADEGLMPRMLKSALVIDDLSKVTKDRRMAIEKEGLQSLVSIPLKAKEKTLGVIVIASRSPRTLASEGLELLTAIGNQVGVAVDRANLQAQELRAAILEERQHMAQQMHDDIAQTLGYLGLEVDNVMGSSSLAQNVQVQAELEEIRTAIEDAYERVHSSIMRLREDVPGHFDLGAALPEIISEFEKQTGCRLESRVDGGQLLRLPPSVSFQATYIIREALTNVRKHSGADSVHLTLQGLEDGRVEVTIQDNGRGFDLDSEQQSGGGFGLRFMRERAERVGGSLRIESGPGQGTRVVVSLPSGQGS